MRTFELGDVLTITTDCLVSRRGIEAAYDVLSYMTGADLFTHQLPRAHRECKPHILAQHPDLAAVQVPDSWTDDAAVLAWLEKQEAVFGRTRDLEPLPAGVSPHRDPLAELQEMVGGKPVIVVDIGATRGES